MKKVDAIIIVNEGEAAIISNPNNLKISIMNYDGINEQESKVIFQDYEDLEEPQFDSYYNEDLGDVADNYHIDKVGITYKEQGNI